MPAPSRSHYLSDTFQHTNDGLVWEREIILSGVPYAELAEELGSFELMPGGAVGGVAFHDGDDAAHDAPAVVGLFDDGLFERFGEVGVGGLVMYRMLCCCNHMF